MTPAFKSFHRNLMDYAGFFPPARLELPRALAEYKAWKAGPQAWMVDHFILPVGELEALGQLDPDGDFPLSVILPHPLPPDLPDRLGPFARRIHALETCLPPDLESQAEIREYMATPMDQATRAGVTFSRFFLESPSPSPDVIAALGRARIGLDASLAFKLRCGGQGPNAVPRPPQVAALIHACAAVDLPLKFTAGLHQPFSSPISDTPPFHYGFVNIFSAALLAFGAKISPVDILACLTDPNPGHFVFRTLHFTWKAHTLDQEELWGLRNHSVTGFGTCSIEEPVDALKALGLIPSEETPP